MWDIVIPAIAGLISGAFGSLLAPWANWGVEKKRLQQASRSKLIEEARAVLAESPAKSEFRVLPIYSRLRPHLSETTHNVIEGTFSEYGNEVIIVVEGNGRHSGVNPYAQLVLDEIAKLEARWNLV